MGETTYVRSSFAGGEWSQMAQGRFHDPKYRTALNLCLNIIPVETEGAVRRPGFKTIFGATTRSGAPGRVLKFDFQGNAPYTMEFTDGHLRLISGTSLATTNDSQAVTSITNGVPATVGLAGSPSWNTGDQVYFTGLLVSFTPLQNRLFTVVAVSGNLVQIADAVTGAFIDSTTMGSYTDSATLNRVLDISTPYSGGSWANLRSVQTDNFALLLHNSIAPQALAVLNPPNPTASAVFAFGAATFNDGPYLDPFTNGALVTPNQKTGIVQLAVSFPQYSATTSYPAGAFVTSSSVNYVSLVDQNINNTPASSPTKWNPTAVGSAINNGQGFLQTDVGRLVRLFSEPAYWVAATTYSAGNVVSYNPLGLPGQTTYWQSLTGSNTGNAPGVDLTNWEILELGGQKSSPALWTWGKIVSLANLITTTSGGGGSGGGGNPAIVAPFGDMTGNGGLVAAFDGNLSKLRTACSQRQLATALGAGASLTFRGYVGMQFASGVQLASVTVVPPSNKGMVGEAPTPPGNISLLGTVFLYGSNSLPSSYNNGTLLGSAPLPAKKASTSEQTTGSAPVSIVSNNQTSTFTYLWVALQMQCTATTGGNLTVTVALDQVEFVATSTSSGSGVTTSTSGINVELLGAPLLYTTPILTWRLGVYSGTTGYPTCGTYADGRLWLAGSIPNRVDASFANGFVDNQGVVSVNFAPTDQYGNVLDSSGISAIFNAPDANPILWMLPDLQGVLAGTQASEWLVFSPTGGGFSPTNIAVRRTTRIGSANVEPTKTEHTVAFVQKFQRSIVEYFADVFSGKFTAPKLTANALHLTTGGVQELAYQQELCPIIWARVNVHGLIGCTYKRDTLMTSAGPTHMGWHRHVLGSGWQVVSICTGSSVNGSLDALNIVSFNAATGLYYVEVLTDILDEGSLLSQGNYVDESVIPTSSVSTTTPSSGAPYGGLTLNGLWYLNGFTVTAWLGGLDCGDYLVANGSIVVPYGDGLGAGTANGLFTAAFVSTGITANGNRMFTPPMPMVIGFTYVSQGDTTVPIAPEEAGARAGPGFGKLRRSHYIMAAFEGSQGVLLGIDDIFYTAMFTAANGQPLTIDQQQTGFFRDRFTAEYNFTNRIGWQVTRPYICNVTAIGAAVETADI